MFKDICELNNRTKEAKPEDFVKNSDRYYITRAPKRGKKTVNLDKRLTLAFEKSWAIFTTTV